MDELGRLRAQAAHLADQINQLSGGVTRRQAVAGGAVVAAGAAWARGGRPARPVNATAQLAAATLPAEAFVIGNGNLVFLEPSGDLTGATDTANINTLLSADPPYAVVLQEGTFYVDAPIALPDQGYLAGTNPSWGIPAPADYGAGGGQGWLPLQGSIIQAGSGFSGAALITMGSPGTTQHGGQRLYGITLAGTDPLSGNSTAPTGTHGILSVGYVGGVKMRDLVVWGMPGDGLHAANDGTTGHQPDFWQVESSKFSHSVGYGVYLQGLSDSWFSNCESTGNTGDGWHIIGGADSRWIGCRGDSNTSAAGWNLTPTGGAPYGYLEFTNCEAALNSTGWVFNGGTPQNYFLSNCISHSNPNLANSTAPFSYTAGAAVSTSGCNFSVWRTMVLENGWAKDTTNSMNVTPQFQRRGNELEIIGMISAASATSATFFTLPAVYFPATVGLQVSQQQIPAGATAGVAAGHTPYVQCDTSGNLSLMQAALGTNATYMFHGFISLDA